MLTLPSVSLVLLIALAFDALFGWPEAIFKRIGHPVSWIGAFIAYLDRRLNSEHHSPRQRRFLGVLSLVLLLAVVGVIAILIQVLVLSLLPPAVAMIVLGVLIASLIAQRSLYNHVAAVAQAMESQDLAASRQAVAMIVGRNPHTLDQAGIGRAAIESLAENFSDGIVAPVFWAVIAGLPGIALYKTVNTADSMIGHRNQRYQQFGWASARLDDVLNLPASRLAAILLVLAAALHRCRGRMAIQAVLHDAPKHRSPNAGWPEAAMAGALGLALGGPRIYGQDSVQDAWMGQGRAVVTAADIRAALTLYVSACLLQGAVIMIWASWIFMRYMH